MEKNKSMEEAWAGIEVMALSAHLPINIKPVFTNQWALNGPNNSNWQMYNDAFDDSPTNSSIIKGTINYVYGDGLTNINEPNELLAKANVSKHLSKKDAKLLCHDWKKFGGMAMQIIWNSASNPEDKKPILIKYFKIFKLAISIDEDMEVNGYWYSFNWAEQGKYVPQWFPKYDGKYKGNDVELIIFQRPSSNDFYSQPDYISGIRYAQLEGEIQNWSYNHVLNGFQGSKLINCNNGIPSEELKVKYTQDLLRKITGTDNANKTIISFNKSIDNATTIENIAIPELNAQYVQFKDDSREGLISAHQASPVIFANKKDGGGLSNNANEIETATAMMYQQVIRPMQEDILDSLMEIFVDIDPSIELGFIDFKTFSEMKADVAPEDNTNQIIN